jgi:hypothetical protein
MSVNFEQSNQHFYGRIVLDRPMSDVWSALIDVNKWPVWDTELKHSALQGEFAVGTKGVLTPRTGPKLRFHLSEVSLHTSYSIDVKLPVGWLIIKRSLSALSDATEFCDDIQFTGAFKGPFGFFIGRRFRKLLPQVMQNFKSLVEAT